MSNMHPEFDAAMTAQTRAAHNRKGDYCDWLTFIGCPLLYDAGLFVNRSKEDHERTTERRNRERHAETAGRR